MISLGIDIGKNKHVFAIVDLETGNVIGKPMTIQNNQVLFERQHCKL